MDHEEVETLNFEIVPIPDDYEDSKENWSPSSTMYVLIGEPDFPQAPSPKRSKKSKKKMQRNVKLLERKGLRV